jgi:hypothetical protein
MCEYVPLAGQVGFQVRTGITLGTNVFLSYARNRHSDIDDLTQCYQPGIWKQYVAPKCYYLLMGANSVTAQKNNTDICTAESVRELIRIVSLLLDAVQH